MDIGVGGHHAAALVALVYKEEDASVMIQHVMASQYRQGHVLTDTALFRVSNDR